MSIEANRVRVWMRRVMDDKQWSAQRWATEAGTSPTNITRFLRNSKFLPTTRTIAKLAAVAGSQPEIGGMRIGVVSRRVPLYRSASDALLHREVEGMVAVMQEVSDRAFAVVLTDGRLSPVGGQRGDTLVCEPVELCEPKVGDLVAYANGEEGGIGQFTGSGVARFDPMEILRIEDVVLVGTGVELMRSLRP